MDKFLTPFYVLYQKILSLCKNLENRREFLCLDLKMLNKFFPAFFSDNHYEFLKKSMLVPAFANVGAETGN